VPRIYKFNLKHVKLQNFKSFDFFYKHILDSFLDFQLFIKLPLAKNKPGFDVHQKKQYILKLRNLVLDFDLQKMREKMQVFLLNISTTKK
jgi:hypothetical protein